MKLLWVIPVTLAALISTCTSVEAHPTHFRVHVWEGWTGPTFTTWEDCRAYKVHHKLVGQCLNV